MKGTQNRKQSWRTLKQGISARERSKEKMIDFRLEGPESVNGASTTQDKGLLIGNNQQIESWAAQNSWRIG